MTTSTNEVKPDPNKLMTIQDLADLLAVPASTIYGWRYRGFGPPSVRVGGHVRYRRETVESWLDENTL